MGRLDTNNRISTGPSIPVPLQWGLGAWMSAVIAAAFLYVPPAAGFAVPDAARIVIFHVPCAMISVLAYLVSTVYAIAYLKNGTIASDAKSAISAGLGFTFTALATVTGMIFAKVQWGAAWNWDPRETTILILMIVYAAYFALRGAIPGTIARARISAAYNILACVIMPYLVFVLPRMMGGLHPDRASLSIEYRIVMGAAMIGFMWLYIWLFRIHVRISEYEIAWRRARNV